MTKGERPDGTPQHSAFENASSRDPSAAVGACGDAFQRAAAGRAEATPARTSDILRAILAKNPGVKRFSVQRILAAIGSERLEAALVVFSLPAIVPVPTESGTVPLTTGMLATRLIAGGRPVKVPAFILRKTVSRRALAVAIHTILPLLEATEKVVRRRWQWMSHPAARRAIGVLVFVLAIAIAEPLLGFNALHAASVFVMSLGMAEQDGLAVMVGVAVGLASLVMLAASGLSPRVVRSKVGALAHKVARRLGIRGLTGFLSSNGYDTLAGLLSLRPSDLLLLWDPERSNAAARRPRAGTRATRRDHGSASRTRAVATIALRPNAA